MVAFSCYDYDGSVTFQGMKEALRPKVEYNQQEVSYQNVSSREQQIRACNNIKDPKVRQMCLSRIK